MIASVFYKKLRGFFRLQSITREISKKSIKKFSTDEIFFVRLVIQTSKFKNGETDSNAVSPFIQSEIVKISRVISFSNVYPENLRRADKRRDDF
jgi:hypothetical protein